MNIAILGASYGSLLCTKLLMAGHDVTLICTAPEVEIINAQGTVVFIRSREDNEHKKYFSRDFSGKLNAVLPNQVDPSAYDLICFAIQEPQCSHPCIKTLLQKIAQSHIPCLSLMNMPPLPFLRRLNVIESEELLGCYNDPSVWDEFEPGLVSLCSPDPQAFRIEGEPLNVLHVGLATNFKASPFTDENHNTILHRLAQDILEVEFHGHDVPVKLRLGSSIHMPLAKWPMSMVGNYRCITADGEISIKTAVNSNQIESKAIYNWVEALVLKLGGSKDDQIEFEKYLNASQDLTAPSSAARAVGAGAISIERPDKLIKVLGDQHNMQSPLIDHIVEIVDSRLEMNLNLS